MNEDLVSRLETAISFLQDGMPFTVGSFVLRKTKHGRLHVYGDSSCYYIENVQLSTARIELQQMKEGFLELMNLSRKFKDFAQESAGIDFILVYNAGTAGIPICAEIEGEFKDLFGKYEPSLFL
jgi:hypothetical protein